MYEHSTECRKRGGGALFGLGVGAGCTELPLGLGSRNERCAPRKLSVTVFLVFTTFTVFGSLGRFSHRGRAVTVRRVW